MDLMMQWRVFPLLSLLASFLFFYIKTSSKPSYNLCSMIPYDTYTITSKNIVTPQGIISGAVEVKGGYILSVIEGNYSSGKDRSGFVIDYGDAVVMPGLIDVHSHLDEPGKSEWEGFESGTKAAAAGCQKYKGFEEILWLVAYGKVFFKKFTPNFIAGGITTLIDMPLNSVPSTVSVDALKLKLDAAEENIYVDVGFWGGLVPENAFDAAALKGLLDAGVLGLKSFMCPSGINDFPMTNASHIKEGLHVLAKYRRPLLVHAEVQLDSESTDLVKDGVDARSYSTYLKTRPPSMEEAAIRELLEVTRDTREGGSAQGSHLHIVHLSDSRVSLDLIKTAKNCGDSITVETCPHYLAFSAEEIKDGDTRFKCAPPIRDAENKDQLWDALRDGHIDMLSSDHSPTVPELKLLDEGDFLRAWGGISSLQYVLPVTWSYGRKYGISLNQLAKWWSERPAKLAGLPLKGGILSGNHADIVVWDPENEFALDKNHIAYHKNPAFSES
ncbi:hypothetical protein Sjap_000208 [Stephania japonica]|uniref:Allantoinase n=1 Tax=Stephania japonica TaxID=461633 RepID=A0AAP0KHJ8_9MAGN